MTLFEPDGAYSGVPYRVLPDNSIEALMQGAIVRFHSVDHLISVLGDKVGGGAPPEVSTQSPSATSAPVGERKSHTLVVAVSIVGGVALIGFIGVLMLANNADDMWVHSLKKIAQIQVKIKLGDPDATFENVIFHPMEGQGRFGNSYTCGYVTPSYNTKGPAKRFLYLHQTESTSLTGMDRIIDGQIASICDRAPLPVDAFDTTGDQMRMKSR